jgi:O-antigen/teichoic acid export membrane protein
MDERAHSAAVPAGPPPQTAPFWPVAERLVRHGAWFVIFVVLAPLLGPHDYGLFVVAMAGVAIIETLLSEVAARAIMALEPLEEAHLSTAFLANIAVGAAMSLLLYGVADEFAAMADDAVLGDIYQSLAVLPALSALTAVPIALLRRRGRTPAFFVIALVGAAAGGSAGISLAAVGAGAWSLVAQIVTQRFVEIALLWVSTGRMIGLAWSRRHFFELIAAVPPMAASPALSSIARQVPRLLAGLVLGPTAAGLYLLASGLAEAVTEIFAAPAAPSAGAAGPGDDRGNSGAAAQRETARVLRQGGIVAIPAIVASIALFDWLPALVDPVWWGAIMPAQILVLGAIPAAIQHARSVALVAAGQPGTEARCALLQTLTGVAAVAVAMPYGLVAVSGALLVHGILASAASLRPMRRLLGDRLWEALAGLARPYGVALAIGVALLALKGVPYASFPPFDAMLLLLGSGALGSAIVLLAHGRRAARG